MERRGFPSFNLLLSLSHAPLLSFHQTGEVVDRLDTLQDIDELFAEPAGSGGGGPRAASGAAAGTRGGEGTASFSLYQGDAADPDAGGAAKYEKRQSAARRALGRLFPALLPSAGTLPLTRQDATSGGGRAGLRGRRRSRGGGDGEDGSSRLALLLLVILAGGLLVGAAWVRSSEDGGEALAASVRAGAEGAVHAAEGAVHAAGGAVAAAEGVVEGAVAAAANQAAVAWAAANGAAAPPPPVVG